MREVFVPDHGDGSSSSGSDESDSDREEDKVVTAVVTSAHRLRREAKKLDRRRSIFRSNCALAFSVGFWVAIFGSPLYVVGFYKMLFGFRGSVLQKVIDDVYSRYEENGNETNISIEDAFTKQKMQVQCGPHHRGKMRNIGRFGAELHMVKWNESMTPWSDVHNAEDVWCGWLSEIYIDNWPNVASLIIFTVYKNTGTTVQFAWQGVVGTFFAWMNMAFMQQLYPAGGKTHPCLNNNAGKGSNVFTVVWHREGEFHAKYSPWYMAALHHYEHSGVGGGTDSRALFSPTGQANPRWSATGELERETNKFFLELHENCTSPTVYESPGYNKWVCLLDTVFVLFLFLISRSSRNAMLFGMSWHVSFMMDFMNPNKGAEPCYGFGCFWRDSVYQDVFTTTVIGAVVAIIAVLCVGIVLPLSHMANLYEDSLAMTAKVNRIWKDALGYLSGSSRSAKRYSIETQIVSINDEFTSARSNAEGAWWETFDIGAAGNRRRLLLQYDLAASDIRDLLTCVRNTVLLEDFKGQHRRFMEAIGPSLVALQADAEDLMYAVLSMSKAGAITEHGTIVINDLVAKVQGHQKDVVRNFHEASPEVSVDLAEEVIFAFAMSFWARKITDFAKRMTAKLDDDNFVIRLKQTGKTFVDGVWGGLCSTWSPSRMLEPEHLKFCIRNWVPISSVFIFSYFVYPVSIFPPYSAVMASTLSLVIVSDGAHQIGSMMAKNTQRLLAVVMGKVLPIIVMLAFNWMECLSTHRLVVQFVLSLLYIYFFTYIYYASSMWGYVGCLIAGFGVYQLLIPCSGNLTDTFTSHYQEIGSVTFAIFVQTLIQQVFRRHSPTNIAVGYLRNLSQQLTDGYEAFFASDLPGMQQAARESQVHLEALKNLLPECDPKLAAVDCGNPDFKFVLMSYSLTKLERMYDEFLLIVVAAKDWVVNETTKGESSADTKIREEELPAPEDQQMLQTDFWAILEDRPAVPAVKQEFMNNLNSTLSLLQSVITEEELSHKELDVEALRACPELESASDLYTQLSSVSYSNNADWEELTSDVRARLTIAVRALENANRHLFAITQHCLSEGSG